MDNEIRKATMQTLIFLGVGLAVILFLIGVTIGNIAAIDDNLSEQPTLGREFVFPDGWTPVSFVSSHAGWWTVSRGWLCERDGIYMECYPVLVDER